MRLLISYENHLSDLGTFLNPGSMLWDKTRPLPVVWNAQTRIEDFLGVATDLYRCVDGALTCEFTPNEQYKELNIDALRAEIGATIYCNQVRERKLGSLRVIESAFIREVYFTHGVFWNSWIED